jgi:ribA/ribD-fused uncharacterized protein
MLGRGIYKKDCPRLKKKEKFEPTQIQTSTVKYFLKSPYKGLLVFHQLGSGKTCTSILISDSMIRTKKVKHVYVLTPGSLRENWIHDYCKKCGEQFIKDNYTFITYNYNVWSSIKTLNFNNSLIIIDEVHKFINGVKNMSKNAYEIYKKIYNSKCKIIALSGTPIFSHTYEWSILGNLLKPETFIKILEDDKVNILNWSDQSVKDEDLSGIISYYPGDPRFYPTIYYKEPIKIKMTTEQFDRYERMFENERKWRNNPPSKKLFYTNLEEYEKRYAIYIMSLKYINSRLITNFNYVTKEERKYEDILVDQKDEEKIIKEDEDIEIDEDDGVIYIQEDEEEIDNKKRGWITNDTFNEQKLLTQYSPKFSAILLNIILHFNNKHVVFSFFKRKGGVNMLKYLLDKCGISNEIYSGDLNDAERRSLLKRFNNSDNQNGEKIKVLLLTEAGAEGITLLEVNDFHIVESSKENLIKQATGRVIRYKSHENLPENRQYVNIWRYFSVGKNNEMTVDEMLYLSGKADIESNEKFINKLIENSIENKPPKIKYKKENEIIKEDMSDYEDKLTEILFYQSGQPYYEFSNFYSGSKSNPLKLTIEGKKWLSTEQYFQAQKFKKYPEYYEIIRQADTPAKAKVLGTQSKKNRFAGRWKLSKTDNRKLFDLIDEFEQKGVKIDPEWNEIRDKVMEKAIYEKFIQNEDLKDLLISTQDLPIKEASPTDFYWGIGRNGQGENKLGQILEKVRYKLQS